MRERTYSGYALDELEGFRFLPSVILNGRELSHGYEMLRKVVPDLVAHIRELEADVERAELTEVYTLAWDGEPRMSGEPHRLALGGDYTRQELERGMKTAPSLASKPNLRMERRYVTQWEEVPNDGR